MSQRQASSALHPRNFVSRTPRLALALGPARLAVGIDTTGRSRGIDKSIYQKSTLVTCNETEPAKMVSGINAHKISRVPVTHECPCLLLIHLAKILGLTRLSPIPVAWRAEHAQRGRHR